MRALLGVDGGGTKTDLLLVGVDGAILARARRGTTNYHQAGFDGVRAVLADGLRELLQAAALEASSIVGATLGLGAVGEIEDDMARLRPAVAAALAPIPHVLVNDCEVAWAGALALGPGINVVAGTGSLAYGRNAAGASVRVGGWAWAVGDEGSAHWLGRRLLHVFTQQSDLRRPRTALHGLLRQRLRLKDDIEARFLATELPRQEVAALATILVDAHAAGDPMAEELWRDAAAELALHVRGARAQVEFLDPVQVSGTGGVFALPVVRRAFAEGVRQHGGEHVEPRADPAVGAVLLAAASFSPASVPTLIASRAGGDRADTVPAAQGRVAHAP